MWQKENQDISMIASEQSPSYQVYPCNEEVKDNKIIILKNRKYWFGK